MQKLNKLIEKNIYIFLILTLIIIFSNNVQAEFFEAGLKEYIIKGHQIRVPVFNPVETIELRTKSPTVIRSEEFEDLKLEAGKSYFISLMGIKTKEPDAESAEENIQTAAGNQQEIDEAENNAQVGENASETAENSGNENTDAAETQTSVSDSQAGETASQSANEENNAESENTKIEKEMRLTVQIFASSFQDKAQEFKLEAEKNIDIPFRVNKEGDLYKVTAGNFSERTEAEKYESQLKELGYSGWIKEMMLPVEETSAGGGTKAGSGSDTAANSQTDTNDQTDADKQNNSEAGSQNSEDGQQNGEIFANIEMYRDSLESEQEGSGETAPAGDSESDDEAQFEPGSESGDLSNAVKIAIYNSSGKKIAEAENISLEGYFEAKGNDLYGKYEVSLFKNSLMLKTVSDLNRLTASLLQHYFRPDAPREALKAQAVIFRTALLYQLQTYGPELSAVPEFEFSRLEPAFRNAVEETIDQVMIRDQSFYYDSDYELRELRKPRTGLASLAKADYSYQEIIDYYYDRSELADLNQLRDSELKFTARVTYGLEFKEIRQFDWDGPRLITIVDYDLSVKRLELKPVLAKDLVPGREDLADLIKRHAALAGVNGGYFHYTGRPLGLLYLDGQLVSEPLYNRTSLMIDENGNVDFKQVDWQGSLQINPGNVKIKLDGVNRNAAAGEAVLYNSYYGREMPALKDKYYDIVIRSGEILGVENKEGSKTVIPPDGYVIRVESAKENILSLIPELKGKDAEVKMQFTPDFEELNISYAVGGGPRLLKNGELNITGKEEKFQPDVLEHRSPRTALGLTADNHLIMLTVDGRQVESSVGMSLEELALMLKELGAEEAMNLDGGGSARMVIRGFTVNKPSEKRLISNGILVED